MTIKVKVKSQSNVQIFMTPWTVADWAPLDSKGKNFGVGSHSLL